MDNSRALKGHITALLTILIWGTTYVSTKILLKSFSPIEILLIRFFMGYIALLVMYPHHIKYKSVKEEMLFMLAGLCGITLYYLFENIALTYTLASNVGIIISIAPFFTALLAHFILDGEKLKLQFFIGFIAAIAGISLIYFNGSVILKLNPLGDFLAILASIIWAVYSVLMRKISNFAYNTIGYTRKVFFYGILFMLPAALIANVHFDIGKMTNITNLLNLVFLGFGASALCFVSWNWAVGILGAVKTSAYIYLTPVITITTSVIILHEKITWMALLGAALTLTGLFISEKKIKNKLSSNSLTENIAIKCIKKAR